MAISKITARALKDAPEALDQSNYNGTGALIPPNGTTAQRPGSPALGALRYNSTVSVLEQYTSDGWVGIEPAPTISSIALPGTQTAVWQGDTVTINGTNFKSGAIAKFSLSGVVTTADSTTRVSSTQLTAVFPTSISTEGTYSVIATNPSGLSATLDNSLTVDGNPIWATSSGSLGSYVEQTALSISLSASEDATGVTYSLKSGALPSGVSLNSSTGALTGTPAAISGDTVYSFTITATDIENQKTDRSFTLTITNNNAPVWVTTAGSLGTVNQNGSAISTINLSATSGGESQTVTYSVTTGSLPTGLSLSSSGAITGTISGYTADGSSTTVSFTVTASDGIDTTARAFSITVATTYVQNNSLRFGF
jgi:FtsP/CotA-like multicopper oxidase with cupredoxin domain